MRDADHQHRATFRQVLAIREFRAVYIAQTLSVVGDQLARIAVGVVVFDRTGSSTLTGVSYAVSYLPWLVGGPTLSILADRFPKRGVMVGCDSGRSVLVGLLAIPGCSTAYLIAIVGLAAVLQPPFTAARAATIPELVGEGDAYTAASTLTNATLQLAVLAGFGCGGFIVTAAGPRTGLLIDSLTFAISSIVIVRCVERRPPVSARTTSWRQAMSAGWSVVFKDQHLRWLVTTSWVLVGTVIATEAIAVPYARAHGDGATVAGLLSASMPLGVATGAVVLGRRINDERAHTTMTAFGLLTPLVLALTAFNPRPAFVAIEWFVAGALSAVTVVANRIFVVSVSRAVRGRAFGVAAAGISGAQGIGALAVGVIAGRTTPATAVGVTCAASFVLLLLSNAKRLGTMCSRPAPSVPSRTRTTPATPSCDLPAS
jgi:MFS family permease